MRVLLINPEFPPSFWSWKETCEFEGKKTLMPPLGLLTVAALLPQEWEFRLADLNTRPLSGDDWEWADLVMLSGMIIQKEGVCRLIRQAKQQRKATVVGGPYATSLSREVLEAGVDFLVRGEGEVTVPYFLAALREGQPGGIFEEDKKPEMTTSPVPRFDLVNCDDYNTLSIQTSRGCPFNCEFCDIVNLYGRIPRYKTASQVIQELATLNRLGWRGPVFLNDDNFIGNRDHARAILTQLTPWMKSHGEPYNFWTQTSVNLGQDLELIDLMTEANFSHVFLGVETPETEILSLNRKYQNIRNPLGKSLANINANGLSVVASFVIGFDQEKPGAGERICQFVEENAIPIVMLNRLQVLPNTDLWDRLQREGRLLEGPSTGDTSDLDFNYVPTRPPGEILAEYMDAIDRLYEPSGYLARAYRHFLRMRPTRRALALQQGQKTAPTRRNKGLPSIPSAKAWKQLLAILWKHGVLRRYRRQFWRQLLGMYRSNPSRLKSYVVCCEMGESLFALRRELLQKWASTNLVQ